VNRTALNTGKIFMSEKTNLPQALHEEISGLERGPRRIVMSCINEGVDVRAMKEGVSLQKAGNQVIMLRRSVSGHKPMEVIDNIIFLSAPAVVDGNDLLARLREKSVSETFGFLDFIGLWLMGWMAKILGYSFGVARITKRSAEWFVPAAKFLVAKVLQPWHILSVYKLYQCEYVVPLQLLKPDVVHAQDLYMLRLSIAGAKATGAKCIYDAHELESERRPSTHKVLTRSIVREEEKFAPQADGVITVSPMIADLMAKNLEIKRPTLVLNAPLLGLYREQSIRQKLSLDKSTPLVAFVGKIYDIYRHDHKVGTLLEAVASLKGVHIALIGPMGDAARTQTEELAQKLNCVERIHFAGSVPAEELVSFIRDVDVGTIVMPPHTGNTDLAMPNKLFEYILANVAIVSFSNRQIRALLEELSRGVFVQNVDADELSQGIVKAFELKKTIDKDKSLSDDLTWTYSWGAQGESLIKLYTSLDDSKEELPRQ